MVSYFSDIAALKSMVNIFELLKDRNAKTDKEAFGAFSCTMTKGKWSIVFEMRKLIVTSYVKTDLTNTQSLTLIIKASGPLQNFSC